LVGNPERCQKEDRDHIVIVLHVLQFLSGLPVFVIVLIVIGLLIFLVFVGLLTVCCAYKQKTGKYRVKWRRDKWRKKTKKVCLNFQLYAYFIDFHIIKRKTPL